MKSMKLFAMAGVVGIGMLMTGCSTVFVGEPKAKNEGPKPCQMQNAQKPIPPRNVNEPQIILHYHFVIPCKWEKMPVDGVPGDPGANRRGMKADHRKQRGRTDWNRPNKKPEFVDENFKKDKKPGDPGANRR